MPQKVVGSAAKYMMNKMQLYLPFSPDEKRGVTIDISGERPLFVSRRAASITGLQLQCSNNDAAVIFSDKLSAGDKIFSNDQCETEIFQLPGKTFICQLPPEKYIRRNCRATVKQLFTSAVRQSWKEGIKTALLHGAMLTHPDYPGKAALIFGISGMGKSTTAKRWRSCGGETPADDMILLYQDENGDFFARPLPTWSRYPEAVDFRNCCSVNAILRLQRGERDEIQSTEPLAWAVDCSKALIFHHYLPDLNKDISSEIAAECMKFGERLRHKFGSSDLNTNLDGNLYPVLEKIFTKQN